MNINCVICSDLFDPGAEIFVTKCGHMFHYTCLMNWLERSKTCPQCRNRVTETNIHRVYFNLANTDNASTDVGTLVNKIENLQFQLSLKDKDLKSFKEKADKYKKQNIGLRQEISDLENGHKTQESVIHALKEQISYFKRRARETDLLTEENTKLKSKISAMENVQKVIDGSRGEIDNLLRNETNLESLAMYATMLKKSLIEADLKKNEVQHSLKKATYEASKYKRDYLVLDAKYSELKREYDHFKINNDKEKSFLRNKLKNLNKEISSGDSVEEIDTSIMRIASESPINFNRTPRQDPMAIQLDDSIEELDTNAGSEKASDSPYLQVKSSGVEIDYTSFLKTRVNSNSSSKPGFSIFKSSGTKLENVKISKPSVGITYDGLGGSSKPDVFPSPKPVPTSLKRRKPTSSAVSSHKFKKLAPSKTTKITDVINLCDSSL